MSDTSNVETESERLAREQGSKSHAEEKHRRQAGQDTAPDPVRDNDNAVNGTMPR